MAFSTLGLAPYLLKTIAAQKYQSPYPIQQVGIPAILAGKDIFGIAQTGSGKTACFVLPILQLLQKSGASKNRHIRALVLVPTRELAVQVGEVFHQFSSGIPQKIKTLTVFGGVSINPQMMQMQGTDILVATPGRLLDLIDSNAVRLSSVELLVLDEADKMLNLGFRDEINRILTLLPRHRQNLLFSATAGDEVDTIKEKFLADPLKIIIPPEEQRLDLITQKAFLVPVEKKGVLLRNIIKHWKMSQVLVFVSSTYKADHVVVKLKKHGIGAAALHGKKSQGARTKALKEFKNGQLNVLVATDLASRGIDIQFLPYVINYELPRSPTDYIHRIGRTGRAYSSGEAISFISPEEEHHFKVIQKKMGKKVDILTAEGMGL